MYSVTNETSDSDAVLEVCLSFCSLKWLLSLSKTSLVFQEGAVRSCETQDKGSKLNVIGHTLELIRAVLPKHWTVIAAQHSGLGDPILRAKPSKSKCC